MPKKNRGTDAWKELVKMHKKGPKRITLNRKKRPADHTPVTDMKQSKIVQLVSKDGFSTKNVIIILYKERFDELRLKVGKTYTTSMKTPFRTARILKKALTKMTHNDYVLKNVKLEKYAGKCVVFAGISKNPDAIIYYIPEKIIHKCPIVRPKEGDWEEL